MRDIKFRAFYKDMIWTPESIQDGGWELASLWLNAGLIHYMQYTGLKDKNGKEIYEGDILREISELSEEDYQNRTGQAVYEKNIASFMILVDGGYCHLNNGDWGRGDTLKFTEVIGNIYENPDLLTTP